MKLNNILLAISFISTNINGQSDTLISLRQVEIMADRLATPFSMSARTIQLLSKEDIRHLPANQIAEILSYLPGLDIRQRGPQGVQADLSIRGGSFDQSLVLINGIKLSDPQTGHHLLNLVLQPEQIERIEVLKGPGTRIYGPNAFSGAVNIITKVSDKRQLSGTLSLGEFGLKRADVTLSLPFSSWKQSLSCSFSEGNGYRYNTDFTQQNLLYQAQSKLAAGTLHILAGYNKKAFGANGFYANENAKDQYEETQTIMASISYKIEKEWGRFNLNAYYRNHHDMYLYLRQNPSFYKNEHTTQVSGLEGNLQVKNAWGMGAVGFEVRREQIESNNLGNHFRNHVGIYLEERITLGKFQFNPGIFNHYMNDYGIKFYPGIDISYSKNVNFSIFANVARSFRVPTYTDLYYVGPSNNGNPSLQPESAWTYEIGGRYIKEKWNFSASIFQRDASRIIEWVRISANEKWRPENYLNVITSGAEVILKYNLKGSFLQNTQFNYAWLRADIALIPGYQSRYVFENLKYQAGALFTFLLPGKIFASTAFRYFQRINNEKATFLTDVQANRNWGKSLNTFLQISNFFDIEYREIGTVPMPGKWLRAGIKFNI
jgi:iron complex outermembrane receptor protein